MNVISQELLKLLPPLIFLSLASYIAFSLCGYYDLGTLISIILGTIYIIFNFYMIAYACDNAMDKGPAGAQKYMFAQYMLRYMLTGGVIYLSLKIEFLNPLAVVIPMFFPKLITVWKSIFVKKGG